METTTTTTATRNRWQGKISASHLQRFRIVAATIRPDDATKLGGHFGWTITPDNAEEIIGAHTNPAHYLEQQPASSSDKETPGQALARIAAGYSSNDAAAIVAFANRGIDPADITPRGNVLTYKAWRAKGRQVAKGAIGVAITVYAKSKDKSGKEQTRPRSSRLFHESQTIAANDPKGMRPDAWSNPALIRKGTYGATVEQRIDRGEPVLLSDMMQ